MNKSYEEIKYLEQQNEIARLKAWIEILNQELIVKDRKIKAYEDALKALGAS